MKKIFEKTDGVWERPLFSSVKMILTTNNIRSVAARPVLPALTSEQNQASARVDVAKRLYKSYMYQHEGKQFLNR